MRIPAVSRALFCCFFATACAGTVFAQSTNNPGLLDITESEGSLSATFTNGGGTVPWAVNNTGGDTWSMANPFTDVSGPNAWYEPEDPNYVNFGFFSGGTFTIQSDALNNPGSYVGSFALTPFDNGANHILFTSDNPLGTPVNLQYENVRFTDSVASVPDGGATLAMLGAAFACLAMFHRRFSQEAPSPS